MKQTLLLFGFLLFAATGFAQSNSGIAMKVVDEAGEGVINWTVKIYQGGREVMTVYTDDDGEALAKPLAPNVYEVRVELNNVVRSVQNIAVGIAETPAVVVDFRPSVNCAWPSLGGCGRDKPILRQNGNSSLTAAELEAMPTW